MRRCGPWTSSTRPSSRPSKPWSWTGTSSTAPSAASVQGCREPDLRRDEAEREVFYDIYSNVHYGYVGRAAGFDADTLIKGASLGESLITGDDDQGDQITMRIGIEPYDKYGDTMTEDQLRQGINDAMDKTEQARRSPTATAGSTAGPGPPSGPGPAVQASSRVSALGSLVHQWAYRR
ncbi:polymorphic toxin type 44 domain-containing protein [Streptomyces sp. NPDC056883]|uniref:polymorphic toxin type 44 domain-containing protein n=1 Tax=Streptomyces sp. NPDC056883 TaxID=3345959 RepID=UPI0036ACF000